jgi:hypothetical protein
MRNSTEKRYEDIFDKVYPKLMKNSSKINGNKDYKRLFLAPNSRELLKKHKWHSLHVEGLKQAGIIKRDESTNSWFINISKEFNSSDFIQGINDYHNKMKTHSNPSIKQQIIDFPIEYANLPETSFLENKMIHEIKRDLSIEELLREIADRLFNSMPFTYRLSEMESSINNLSSEIKKSNAMITEIYNQLK